MKKNDRLMYKCKKQSQDDSDVLMEESHVPSTEKPKPLSVAERSEVILLIRHANSFRPLDLHIRDPV